MSRNGSGVYSLPAGNPVVTGTTISSSWANTTLSDIATALTGSVAADGQTAMTGNLQMGNNKITGLAIATASGDALSYGQAATISALTVTGAFSANGGATLGDASGDALTINSSAVSIPNGLNFDSNTLVIDATNDRVGIGTSSPAVKLQVASSTAADGAIARLELTNTSVFGGDKYGQLQFFGNDSSSSASGVRAYVAGEAGGANGEAALVFGTANTNAAVAERARIDSSGNLLVGKTADNNNAGVIVRQNGEIYGVRDGGAILSLNRLTSDGQVAYFFKNTSAVGSISVTASSTSYATSSDYRLKENIAPMTGALATISALKPVTYKWKIDGSNGQGFIAHELQAVVPDCVTGEKDAVDEEGNPKYQGIDTSFLVATLTAAIQEQQAIITDLKARIETLESK